MKSRLIDKLNEKLKDETLTPEQREKCLAMSKQFRQVYEKRAAMQDCPALCLINLAGAVAKGSDRAIELAFRYTNREFWNNRAFCLEAARITSEALEWIPDTWQDECKGQTTEL